MRSGIEAMKKKRSVLGYITGVIKLPLPIWGDQTMQMYSEFEVFPLE